MVRAVAKVKDGVTLSALQRDGLLALLRDLPSDAWLSHGARIRGAIAALEGSDATGARSRGDRGNR